MSSIAALDDEQTISNTIYGSEPVGPFTIVHSVSIQSRRSRIPQHFL
jgi:hypothetical protein